MIPKETIQAIRQALPIEEIAGGYVQLRNAGQNLMGLCPFHEEKTPSFKVHPAKQIYRCFGCGAGGDVFDFVARIERTDFLGAVKSLAARAAIPLSGTSRRQARQLRSERAQEERVAQVLADAERGALTDARDNLHRLLALRRQAEQRLIALESGARPRWADEAETCWGALHIVADEFPKADAAYCISAFAAPRERYEFALHPNRRLGMIHAALERGHVANERGHRFEVLA
jgi:hypothetical protein